MLQLLAEASVHAAATHSLKVPLLHGVQIQELPNPADPTNQSENRSYKYVNCNVFLEAVIM